MLRSRSCPVPSFFLAGVGTFLIVTCKTYIKSYRAHRNYILSSGLNRTNDDRGIKKVSTFTGSGSLKFEIRRDLGSRNKCSEIEVRPLTCPG